MKKCWYQIKLEDLKQSLINRLDDKVTVNLMCFAEKNVKYLKTINDMQYMTPANMSFIADIVSERLKPFIRHLIS